jgi:hypothetical protein
MPEIPAGAQRSPDGNYWWDGGQWQLVEQAQAETPPSADSTQHPPTGIPADAQRSPDGNYWWDGDQWRPVEDNDQAAQHPDGEPFAFDLDDFPALKLYAEADSADEVLRRLGIDVAALNSDDEPAA